MWETANAFSDFKDDPTFVNIVKKIALLEKLFGDVEGFDADITWTIEGHFEVEVFYAEAGKCCVWVKEDAVDVDFGIFR